MFCFEMKEEQERQLYMFGSVFATVAIMFVYMLIGFLLCKSKKATVSHAKTLSAFLIYVLSPAMIINSFLSLEFSKENVILLGESFLITLATQLLFFGLLYIFLHKKYDDARYRIMSVGGVLGNVGFIGMPLVASVFPDNPIVLCYSSMNVLAMNLIVFTVGTFLITNDKKYISIKNAILNPTTISMIIAIPIFALRIKFPQVVEDSIWILAKMVTPLCMFILGMRLSESNFKKIFTGKFVYITCLLKLVVYPCLVFLLVKWLPFADDVLKTSVIVLAMTPSGAIIESLAELHESEQGFAAEVVLVTTLMSIITIPLMAFLLV